MAQIQTQTESRLSRRAAEVFFGRQAELEALLETLTPDGPLVSFLHGIAGLGKSSLLSQFSLQATSLGAVVTMMDCRQVEPTAAGFLGQWGLLIEEELIGTSDAAKVVMDSPRIHVLCLDHYETFLLLDTWLRQDLMPVMPDNFRLVMASRRPPVSRWLTTPGWHGLIRAISLPPMDKAAVRELLLEAKVPENQWETIANRTHGNPLALKLAASAARSHVSVSYQAAALEDVMQELTGVFLSEVSEPKTRDALERASVARRITHSLLRVLPGVDSDCFEKLRRLPFVDTWPDGLRLHDAVREAIASTLKATDPERYFSSRRQAWSQLREDMKVAPKSELWRTTADLLFLIENPVIREAFFPSGDQELAVEPAQTADWMQIRDLIRRHDGDAAIAPLTSWWQHHPEAFRVARNKEDQVVAFYCMADADVLDPAVIQADPVTAAWERHLGDDPMVSGSRALFLRRWLMSEKGEAPSPAQAACWLDAKRVYMELRPALRRVYLTVVDLPVYAPVATQLGFTHLPDCTELLGEQTYQTAMLDFGCDSVDGWISRLVGDEMGVAPDSLLDHKRRTLNLHGQEICLTPLEFQLATYLESRAGITTSRFDILTEVWGHVDETASSNVVDAVVKSLRRKLGSSAQILETVRGFGYRWQKS
jgi:hypothetical protein